MHCIPFFVLLLLHRHASATNIFQRNVSLLYAPYASFTISHYLFLFLLFLALCVCVCVCTYAVYGVCMFYCIVFLYGPSEFLFFFRMDFLHIRHAIAALPHPFIVTLSFKIAFICFTIFHSLSAIFYHFSYALIFSQPNFSDEFLFFFFVGEKLYNILTFIIYR